MIQDIFDCAGLYAGACRGLIRAVDFARRLSPETPTGRIELQGEDLYAIISTYTTKAPEELNFEAHRRYIDVQILLSGQERIDVTQRSDLRILQPYAENTDVMFYAAPSEFTSVFLEPGQFVVLFPQDVHKPCLSVNYPMENRKLVVKIRV